MKKSIRKFCIAGMICIPLALQGASLKTDSIDIDKNFDSLISTWHAKPADADELVSLIDMDSVTINTDHPDSFYISRLQKIPSVIQLVYNNAVRNCIGVYTIKKRDKLAEILGLKDYYFPIMEEILDKYGIPLEFKYLSVIESSLNPRIVSKAGATGLWQFMLGTGRLYKLNINTFVDERRDLYAATNAAARYLKDLYNIYGDWGLVIAAYNCGPGNVNKAIRRSGGKRDYWDIYSYLPRETRSYYPIYIAATYALNYYKEHNIVPARIEPLPVSDTMMVSDNVHLQQVADVLNVPIDILRNLNPQYRRDILPGRYMACPLRIPAQYATKFIDLKDSIVRYKSSEFFAGDFKVLSPTTRNGRFIAEAPRNAQKITHKVVGGETLGKIAEKYKVNVSDLQYWNDISSKSLKAGKKLIVYVSKKNAAKATETSAKKEAPVETITGEYVTYKVKSGDTIWKIAGDYNVSSDELMKWNNISDGKDIRPGQTIKIRKMN